MIHHHIVKEYHQMQETRNNSFGSKKLNTTLRQSKTSKHECRNTLLLYFGIRAYHLTKGRVPFFRPKTLVPSFLNQMVFFYKVIINHSDVCMCGVCVRMHAAVVRISKCCIQLSSYLIDMFCITVARTL